MCRTITVRRTNDELEQTLVVSTEAALVAYPAVGAVVGLMLVGVLGLAGFGCTVPAGGEDLDSGKSVVRVRGLQPDWNVDEMVRRSDAVVVATVAESLGSNRFPGPSADGDEAKYDREYRDYLLTVETAYYPASLSGSIAVMTGPYPVQSNPDILIDGHSDIPLFAVGDRVLVFLDSLDDSVPSEGPGKKAPDGYNKSRYYRTITGSHYGKVMEDGGEWSDSRSTRSLTLDEVRQAVQRHKGGGTN